MIVSLVAAITADGFIGREANDRSFDWTSTEDSRFYVSSIKKADAIVMGSTTFKGINLHPRNSHYVIYSRKPENFINPRPEVITAEATNVSPKQLMAKLKKDGRQDIVIAGGSSIYKMFIQSDVIDVLNIIIEPVFFKKGTLLFKDVSFEKATESFELISEEKLNDQGTILQEWRRKSKEA